MLNHIEILIKYLQPHHLKLLLSKRFFVLFSSISISLIIGSFLYYNLLDFKSIPTPIYGAWLFILLLAFIWGAVISPSERKLNRSINNAFKDLRTLEAEKLVKKIDNFLFILPSAKIRFDLTKAMLYREQGEWTKAYEKLKFLRGQPLLPEERLDVDIAISSILLKCGNNKAAKIELDILLARKTKDKHTFRIALLESEVLIVNNNIPKAKDLLEAKLSEPALKNSMKLAFLHQLAICETHQKNYEMAASYYRQSFDIQNNNIGCFAQAERTVENLILNYAKQNKLINIQPYLSKLESLVDCNCIEQLLALNNIKLNLSRQLNNKEDLINTYKEAENEILPRLNNQQKFCYHIFGLRMHWNDAIDFENALKQTMNAIFHSPEITIRQNLLVLKEIIGIIEQAIKKIGQRPDLMTYLSWLRIEFHRLQPEIDKLLDKVPSILPAQRNELLHFKLENIKHEMLFQHSSNKNLFGSFFELLVEKKKIWRSMNNTIEELKALMIVLDEYTSFSQQLNNSHFDQDYRQEAINALDEAKPLLDKIDQNLNAAEYYIGMAYFSCKLNVNKEQAKIWIESFDKTKHSLNHYATWLRDYYQEAKDWIN